MTNKRLLVICNAIDDKTRLERKIVTDSPAATRKVFLMCKALRVTGIDARVISLGRGRANKDGKHYRALKKNISGVPTYYLPYNTVPFLSQLITLIFATTSIFKYKKYQGKTVVMFYNRSPAYIGALLMSRLAGFSTVLDLEDGETSHKIRTYFMEFVYDKFCNKGAILACSALKDATTCHPLHCYYGINSKRLDEKSWSNGRVKFIFSGTILEETGALILLEAINLLKRQSSLWVEKIEFIITGSGEDIDKFYNLQNDSRYPIVTVLGRVSQSEYARVIEGSHVGLSLKLKHGKYSNTTFPSKVIEFSSNGMLVITTDISDVKKVLGSDGGLFLDSDKAYDLTEKIKWVIENKMQAKKISCQGYKCMDSFTNPIDASKELSDFLF